MYLIRTTSLCSQRFASIILSQLSFWQYHPLVVIGNLENDKYTVRQLQRYCLYTAAVKLGEEIPSCLDLGSVLVSKEQSMALLNSSRATLNSLGYRVCVASTTDHLSEIIENVLPSPPGGITVPSWWSSAPSESPDTDEVLLFTTFSQNTLITEVHIKPLRDPHGQSVVYSWRKTVIRAYQLPVVKFSHGRAAIVRDKPCSFSCVAGEDAGRTRPQQHGIAGEQHIPINALLEHIRGQNALYWNAEEPPWFRASFIQQAVPPHQETIDSLLSGYRPVFESGEYDSPPDSSHVLKYSFPDGIVANVITIALLGKNHEQFQGSGYYSCVESVDCRGISL
jgi:hypothetical protein